MAITTEQFKAHAYDIEGHASGKFGISPADIQLWVRDTNSGERERLSFAEASAFVAGGVPDDGAAAELQAEAKAKATRAKKPKPDGEPGQGGTLPLVES